MPDPSMRAWSSALREQGIFTELTDPELRCLLRLCSVERFRANTVLFEEFDPSGDLLIIQRGTVEILTKLPGTDEELLLNRLGDGELLGDLGLVDGRRRSACARTMEETTIVRLEGEGFQRLRADYDRVAFKILRAIARTVCQRLRRLTRRIATQLGRPASLGGARRAPRLPRAHPPSARERAWIQRQRYFSSFNQTEFDLLLGVLTPRRVAPGVAVCRQGDPGRTCYLLVRGRIEVSIAREGSTEQLTLLKPGHLFGQISLIDGKQRSASCVAREEALVLELSRDDFERLFASGTTFTFKFLEAITLDLVGALRRATKHLRVLQSRAEEAVQPAPHPATQVPPTDPGGLRSLLSRLQVETHGYELDNIQFVQEEGTRRWGRR